MDMENCWVSRAARFISQRVDGIAGVIQRSMAELDELERLSTFTELQTEDSESTVSDEEEKISRLPWEVLFEEQSFIFRNDELLKAQILALSLNETNFREPYSSSDQIENGEKTFFNGHDSRALIRRLFQHDDHLGVIYCKLVGKITSVLMNVARHDYC